MNTKKRLKQPAGTLVVGAKDFQQERGEGKSEEMQQPSLLKTNYG
jgi:hypothetical protein